MYPRISKGWGLPERSPSIKIFKSQISNISTEKSSILKKECERTVVEVTKANETVDKLFSILDYINEFIQKKEGKR